MAKPSKASKFFKTLLTVLLLLVIVVTVAINVAFYKSSSAPFNRLYVMQQTNMNDVQYGDAVGADPNKVSEVQAGNVVLCLTSFDNEYKEVLKVIDVTQEEGTTYYYVRSDEQTNDDALKLTQDKVLAKCLWTNSTLGTIITFAKSNLGIGILIGIPCIILLILKITSAVAEQKEAKREEELRKKAKREAKKAKAKESKEADDTTTQKPKPQATQPKVDADEFFNKPANKTIPVKQLSEEESIKQREREEASKMVGADLVGTSKEITRTFNTEELVVSPKHVDALKIGDDSATPTISDEDVHSPNMNEKAIQIRKNLSNSLDDLPTTEPTQPTPTPEVTPSIEDAVVLLPEAEPTPTPTTTEPEPDTTPTMANVTTPEPTPSLDDDDFLNDIIGTNETTTTDSNISDDFLDEILNSIPSSQKTTSTPAKSTTPTTKQAYKSEPRNTKSTVKHHKPTSKAVDDTPFDELIKAIEREKNGIK